MPEAVAAEATDMKDKIQEQSQQYLKFSPYLITKAEAVLQTFVEKTSVGVLATAVNNIMLLKVFRVQKSKQNKLKKKRESGRLGVF